MYTSVYIIVCVIHKVIGKQSQKSGILYLLILGALELLLQALLQQHHVDTSSRRAIMQTA